MPSTTESENITISENDTDTRHQQITVSTITSWSGLFRDAGTQVDENDIAQASCVRTGVAETTHVGSCGQVFGTAKLNTEPQLTFAVPTIRSAFDNNENAIPTTSITVAPSTGLQTSSGSCTRQAFSSRPSFVFTSTTTYSTPVLASLPVSSTDTTSLPVSLPATTSIPVSTPDTSLPVLPSNLTSLPVLSPVTSSLPVVLSNSTSCFVSLPGTTSIFVSSPPKTSFFASSSGVSMPVLPPDATSPPHSSPVITPFSVSFPAATSLPVSSLDATSLSYSSSDMTSLSTSSPAATTSVPATMVPAVLSLPVTKSRKRKRCTSSRKRRSLSVDSVAATLLAGMRTDLARRETAGDRRRSPSPSVRDSAATSSAGVSTTPSKLHKLVSTQDTTDERSRSPSPSVHVLAATSSTEISQTRSRLSGLSINQEGNDDGSRLQSSHDIAVESSTKISTPERSSQEVSQSQKAVGKKSESFFASADSSTNAPGTSIAMVDSSTSTTDMTASQDLSDQGSSVFFPGLPSRGLLDVPKRRPGVARRSPRRSRGSRQVARASSRGSSGLTMWPQSMLSIPIAITSTSSSFSSSQATSSATTESTSSALAAPAVTSSPVMMTSAQVLAQMASFFHQVSDAPRRGSRRSPKRAGNRRSRENRSRSTSPRRRRRSPRMTAAVSSSTSPVTRSPLIGRSALAALRSRNRSPTALTSFLPLTSSPVVPASSLPGTSAATSSGSPLVTSTALTALLNSRKNNSMNVVSSTASTSSRMAALPAKSPLVTSTALTELLNNRRSRNNPANVVTSSPTIDTSLRASALPGSSAGIDARSLLVTSTALTELLHNRRNKNKSSKVVTSSPAVTTESRMTPLPGSLATMPLVSPELTALLNKRRNKTESSLAAMPSPTTVATSSRMTSSPESSAGAPTAFLNKRKTKKQPSTAVMASPTIVATSSPTTSLFVTSAAVAPAASMIATSAATASAMTSKSIATSKPIAVMSPSIVVTSLQDSNPGNSSTLTGDTLILDPVKCRDASLDKATDVAFKINSKPRYQGRRRVSPNRLPPRDQPREPMRRVLKFGKERGTSVMERLRIWEQNISGTKTSEQNASEQNTSEQDTSENKSESSENSRTVKDAIQLFEFNLNEANKSLFSAKNPLCKLMAGSSSCSHIRGVSSNKVSPPVYKTSLQVDGSGGKVGSAPTTCGIRRDLVRSRSWVSGDKRRHDDPVSSERGEGKKKKSSAVDNNAEGVTLRETLPQRVWDGTSFVVEKVDDIDFNQTELTRQGSMLGSPGRISPSPSFRRRTRSGYRNSSCHAMVTSDVMTTNDVATSNDVISRSDLAQNDTVSDVVPSGDVTPDDDVISSSNGARSIGVKRPATDNSENIDERECKRRKRT